MTEAKKFKYWITHQVLPSIRKYGYYKLKKSTDLKINKLMEKINYLIEQNKKIKCDAKKINKNNEELVLVASHKS